MLKSFYVLNDQADLDQATNKDAKIVFFRTTDIKEFEKTNATQEGKYVYQLFFDNGSVEFILSAKTQDQMASYINGFSGW